MKIVKYIINQSGVPVLFKPDILHSDMITDVASAGYAIINYDLITDKFNVKCYGGSESLNVGTNRKDYLVIEVYLNGLLSDSRFGIGSSSKLDNLID
jgi:hypothetical protein